MSGQGPATGKRAWWLGAVSKTQNRKPEQSEQDWCTFGAASYPTGITCFGIFLSFPRQWNFKSPSIPKIRMEEIFLFINNTIKQSHGNYQSRKCKLWKCMQLQHDKTWKGMNRMGRRWMEAYWWMVKKLEKTETRKNSGHSILACSWVDSNK